MLNATYEPGSRSIGAAVLGLLLLASCGSGGTDATDEVPAAASAPRAAASSGAAAARVSPESYRKQFCLARLDLQNGMQALLRKYGRKLEGVEDRSRIRQISIDKADDLLMVVDRIAGRIDAAGIPDVSGGEEGAAAVSRLFSTFARSARTLRAGYERLDPAQAAAFDKKRSDLEQRFGRSMLDAGSALASSTYDPAFDKSIFC